MTVTPLHPGRTIMDVLGDINGLPVMLVHHTEHGWCIALGATTFTPTDIEVLRAAISAYDAATGGPTDDC